ncbi:MAG: hypothetical protein ACRDD8_10530 [Bacteroidales bacterium]
MKAKEVKIDKSFFINESLDETASSVIDFVQANSEYRYKETEDGNKLIFAFRSEVNWGITDKLISAIKEKFNMRSVYQRIDNYHMLTVIIN